VQLDHELALMHDRAEVSAAIAPSFRDLLAAA
jgi:hypothetical protein